MKKFITTLISVLIITLSFNTVFAAESQYTVGAKNDIEKNPDYKVEETVSDNSVKADSLTVNLTMTPCMQVIDSMATVQLYNKNNVLLGEKTEWVGGITKNLTYKFDMPEYSLGETFYLKIKDGLSYLKYYDKVYYKEDTVALTTYAYIDESGNTVYGNEFSLDGCPLYEHVIVVYYDGVMLRLNPKARLVDGTAMVPAADMAEAMGLDSRYDERYNSFVCEINGKQAIFNIDTAYATILGTDTYLPRKCEVIDGAVFVPARSIAEAFGCTVDAIDFGDHIDVIIGKSPIIDEYMTQWRVNREGITSKTKYLVWISKSEYTVRVYLGSQHKWKLIKSFPCAIGAVDSPTITGQFEYLYRISSWNYSGYYVGPCLVFYGNYAIHSTLLQYNGQPYDNRVGVKISHGCVRVHKEDIDWLDCYLPVGSRIYVTE